MGNVRNKYGTIIVEKTVYGDLTFDVRDENGNFIRDKAEGRKRLKQIYKEDRRLARKEFIDLFNKHEDISLDVIKNLLNRMGVGLYNCDGSMLGFYEVFEDIVNSFKEDTESDEN